ncbi:MAG: hypothetical protein WA459_22935 [Stellaceae bacterium]
MTAPDRGGTDIAGISSSGGRQTISAGGVASGATVKGGGSQTVLSGGTTRGTVLSGGSERRHRCQRACPRRPDAARDRPSWRAWHR